MQTLQILNNYIEISEYLNDRETKSLLNSFVEKLNNHNYLLPFIGQFSAGKSKLINHLLGRELLPTNTLETTAFLTYISYGEEHAHLQYVDGSQKEIGIDEVHNLDQETTADSKPIACLYITLPCDLLKNGLTIVDTPGVNTMITTHVKITEELLKSSQYVIYVQGKSMTDSDVLMCRNILSLNIPIQFVRTKADQIIASEESIADVQNKERQKIKEELGIEKCHYFMVTNEENEKDKEFWRTSFSMLTNFLLNDLSANIESIYENSILNRVRVIKERYQNELKNRESLLKMSSIKSVEDLQVQQVRIKSLQDTLKDEIEETEKKFAKRKKLLDESINSEIDGVEVKCCNEFDNDISILHSSQVEEDCVIKYKTALSKSFDKMGQVVTEKIMLVTEETTNEIAEKLEVLKSDLKDVDINVNIDFDLSEVENVVEEQSSYEKEIVTKIEQLRQLTELSEQQLSELGVQKDQLKQLIEEYDNDIKQNQDLLNNSIANHQVTYKQVYGTLAGTLRKVGTVFDVATMFITPNGWASIAGKAGKLASTVNKMTKLGQIGKNITDVLTRIQQDAQNKSDLLKAEKSGDSAKTPNVDPNKPNIFDYLSISHWMGKLGEKIDPPTIEIDIESENQFKLACETKRLEIEKKVQEKMAQARNNGLLDDAITEAKYEKEYREKLQIKLKEQLDELRADYEKEKQKKYVEAVKNQIIEKFKTELQNYSKILKQRASEDLESIVSQIILAANDLASKKLKETSRQLEEIIQAKNNQKDELDSQLQIVNSNLEKVNCL